jgi:hypothetical protein
LFHGGQPCVGIGIHTDLFLNPARRFELDLRNVPQNFLAFIEGGPLCRTNRQHRPTPFPNMSLERINDR